MIGRWIIPGHLVITGLFEMRVCLVLDIGFDGLQRCATAGDDEVARRPEGIAPEFSGNLRQLPLPQSARGSAFEALHDLRQRECGRIADHDVKMIAIGFDRDQVDFERSRALAHCAAQYIEGARGDDPAAIFDAEHQMGVESRH